MNVLNLNSVINHIIIVYLRWKNDFEGKRFCYQIDPICSQKLPLKLKIRVLLTYNELIRVVVKLIHSLGTKKNPKNISTIKIIIKLCT